jgi:hypothetical protein
MIITTSFSASLYFLPGCSAARRYATIFSGTDFLDPATAGKGTKRYPFPFPQHSQPTPHEIFHLPIGASGTDIKARCMIFSNFAPIFL